MILSYWLNDGISSVTHSIPANDEMVSKSDEREKCRMHHLQ